MFNVSTYYLNVPPNIFKKNNLVFLVMFNPQDQSDIAKLFSLDGKAERVLLLLDTYIFQWMEKMDD